MTNGAKDGAFLLRRLHLSRQRDLATLDAHLDMVGLTRGPPPQGILNGKAYILRLKRRRFNRDQIRDPLYASQVLNGTLGLVPLRPDLDRPL